MFAVAAVPLWLAVLKCYTEIARRQHTPTQTAPERRLHLPDFTAMACRGYRNLQQLLKRSGSQHEEENVRNQNIENSRQQV